MRQFLVNSVAAVCLGAITAFSEYKESPEPIQQVETLPQSPTTEELITSTPLYDTVCNLEANIDKFHEEVEKLR